jgi:hypothetical protein
MVHPSKRNWLNLLVNQPTDKFEICVCDSLLSLWYIFQNTNLLVDSNFTVAQTILSTGIVC